MNEFLKMDIFFFVTTLSVVTLTFFGAAVLWRISRVLKNIEHISEQVALESDSLRSDLAHLRTDIRNGKGRLKSVFSFIAKKMRRTPKSSE